MLDDDARSVLDAIDAAFDNTDHPTADDVKREVRPVLLDEDPPDITDQLLHDWDRYVGTPHVDVNFTAPYTVIVQYVLSEPCHVNETDDATLAVTLVKSDRDGPYTVDVTANPDDAAVWLADTGQRFEALDDAMNAFEIVVTRFDSLFEPGADGSTVADRAFDAPTL